MASRSINPKLDRDSEFNQKKRRRKNKAPKESNLPPKNGGDGQFKPGGKSKFPTNVPDISGGGKKNGNGKTNGTGTTAKERLDKKQKEREEERARRNNESGKTNGKGGKTNGNGKTNGKGGKTNGNGKPTKPTKEAVWDSEKFKWVIPQDKTEKTDKPNKEKLKEKTTTGKGPVADPDEYGETLKEEKGKRDKKAADEKEAADAVAKKERDDWLKKTKNSPAARAGFSDDERWALQQKHRKWKSDRKEGKPKKKKRKTYGAMGRGMRR